MFDKIDDEVVFFFFFLKSNATIHHLNLKHVRGSCEPEQRTAHEKLLRDPVLRRRVRDAALDKRKPTLHRPGRLTPQAVAAQDDPVEKRTS